LIANFLNDSNKSIYQRAPKIKRYGITDDSIQRIFKSIFPIAGGGLLPIKILSQRDNKTVKRAEPNLGASPLETAGIGR
jgi:hypothetical protein